MSLTIVPGTIVVAEAELQAASARTRLVGSTLLVRVGHARHHFGRVASLLNQCRHGLPRRGRVPEEQLQAGAQIVLARLPVAGDGETVLRAAAVAQWSDLALPALRRQRVPLVIPERALRRRRDKRQHVRLMNVAEQVLRLDEVIAGVEVAVVF
jgi:hypothetical protein